MTSFGVSSDSNWSITVKKDGSGTFYLSGWSGTGATFPAGTLSFAEELARLERFGSPDEGITGASYYLLRSGQTSVKGIAINNDAYVRKLFDKAARCITSEELRFSGKRIENPW